MSWPFILFMVTLFISASLVSWISYRLWQQYYGMNNVRIRHRLNYFSTDNPQQISQETKTRVFSKNTILNTFFSKSKFANELEAQIVKGRLNIQVDFFLLLVLLSWIFTFLLFSSLDISLLFSMVSASVIGVLPFLTIRMLVTRRQTVLEEQLPNILEFISRAMQAGHTFVGSLQMAAEESPEPIGSEFQEAFREINFGKPVQMAMGDLALRIDCPEMRYFAVAVFVNHEIGGNLATLLSGVAVLIRERLKLKMSVHAMTSEARVSAWILGLLPFAVGLILFAVRPDFIATLWREPAGRTMMAYTLVLMTVGVLWMQRLSKIRF
jgi:tight adherence protein B